MVQGCKKKLDAELNVYFPEYFGEDIPYLDKIREYYYLKVRRSLGENVDRMMEAVAEFFLERQKPTIFDPNNENCTLIGSDRHFEEVVASMEDNGMHGVKELTVFEFYSKIAYYEKKAKALKDKT